MKKSIVIQSDNSGIARAEEFVSFFCDEMHVGNYFAAISVAVGKAVDNAIRHGNCFDKSKLVTIEADNCIGGVYFKISDQGLGFNFLQYGELSEDGCGEGIFSMKMLADRMEYSDGGRTVRLEFFVTGIDASESLNRCVILQKFNQQSMVNA